MSKETTVSLREAIRHGEARYYKPGLPWRIRKGQPEVGVPKARKDGSPSKVLKWYVMDMDDALAIWYQNGWILE